MKFLRVFHLLLGLQQSEVQHFLAQTFKKIYNAIWSYTLMEDICKFLFCYCCKYWSNLFFPFGGVATLLWRKCEDETHTPEIGTWESSGTPQTSEFNYRGQNTLHWVVLYIIGKLLKCRCRKWPRMGRLDICSTSYGKKKGQESNWQFDSRPLKVDNRPDPNACRYSVTHRWKALKESYNFTSDLILIGGLSK
jgi:hypothetical protein